LASCFVILPYCLVFFFFFFENWAAGPTLKLNKEPGAPKRTKQSGVRKLDLATASTSLLPAVVVVEQARVYFFPPSPCLLYFI
jgi:hypothetical protein